MLAEGLVQEMEKMVGWPAREPADALQEREAVGAEAGVWKGLVLLTTGESALFPLRPFDLKGTLSWDSRPGEVGLLLMLPTMAIDRQGKAWAH